MFDFPCNWKSGLVVDPNNQRFGYLTDFNGLGLTSALVKDLVVYFPYQTSNPSYSGLRLTSPNSVAVTAILESVSWNGGVADPFIFSCYKNP